ncbi:MAG TPA: hypothetical protein VF868_10600 [Bacteroidia bacterium]|jgi:hypothetical protein
MKKFADLQIRIAELIQTAQAARLGASTVQFDMEEYSSLKMQSLSFAESIYGKNHSMYIGLMEGFKPFYNNMPDIRNIDCCLGALMAIKAEIDGGWLGTLKGQIMAESFSDFLEMGNYFLNEGYKDPAAVMFGGVLEEHLRQLSILNKLEIVKANGNPKMGGELNDQLKAAKVYNDIVHKAIMKNLAIRNASAHGKYDEFTEQDVKIMYTEILNVMLNNPI